MKGAHTSDDGESGIVTSVNQRYPGARHDFETLDVGLADVEVDGHRPEGAIRQTIGIEHTMMGVIKCE